MLVRARNHLVRWTHMTEHPKSHRVLVVDDEHAIANALKLKLEGDGTEVVMAGNGTKALEQLGSDTFDLVLLDLMMPGTDGFEVLESMHKKNIKTPVIVMSNLGQSEDIARAKKLGAKDYLIKSDTSLSDIAKKVRARMD